MRYWVELTEEIRIYVEACIYDADTPCSANPEVCCLAMGRAHNERLAAAEAVADEPF